MPLRGKKHVLLLQVFVLCGLITLIPLGIGAPPRLMIEPGSSFTYDVVIVDNFPTKTPDISDGSVVRVDILNTSVGENTDSAAYLYNFSINGIFQYQRWEFTSYTPDAIGNYVLGFPAADFFTYLFQNETVLNASGWSVEEYERNNEIYWLTQKEEGDFIYKYHYNPIGILVEYAVQNATTDLERWTKRSIEAISGPPTLALLGVSVLGVLWQLKHKKSNEKTEISYLDE